MFALVSRWLLALALSAVSLPGFADPPASVGRVAFTEGDVVLVPSAGEEELASPTNFPLVSGALLRSGDDGRAEIEFVGLRLWLGSNSELAISQFDDETLRVELLEGQLVARADEPGLRGAPRIVSASAIAELKHAGQYRFTADVASATIAVGEGLARVEAGVTVAYLTAGQQVEVSFGSLGVPGTRAEADDDDFTRWVAARDAASLASGAPRYVSAGMPGWRDLDSSGSWEQSSDYGPMWTPNWVPAGWAPYRFGTWVWLAPWGWTWVDRAPWGFAPFHFGRWTQHRGRWCWVPGAQGPRPVFAPALVAFVAPSTVVVTPPTRRHRPQQWAPLAPHQRFVPTFQASARFTDQINASHARWHRRGDGGAAQWTRGGGNTAWTSHGGEMGGPSGVQSGVPIGNPSGVRHWRGRNEAWPGVTRRDGTGGVVPLPAATLPLTSAPAQVGASGSQPVLVPPMSPRRGPGRAGPPQFRPGPPYSRQSPAANPPSPIHYAPIPATTPTPAAPSAGRPAGTLVPDSGRNFRWHAPAGGVVVVPPTQGTPAATRTPQMQMTTPSVPQNAQPSWRGRRPDGDGGRGGGQRQERGGGGRRF